MAKGHKKVVRRSLTPEEWLRLRFKEVGRWLQVASAPTRGWRIREARYEAPGRYRWLDRRWRAIREGDVFGAPDGTFFVRGTVTVPSALAGLPVFFELVTPTEMLVRIGGELVNGIDPNRSQMPVLDRARGGETFPIELETYIRSAPDDMRVVGTVHWGCTQTWRDPRLVCPDRVVEQFVHDVQVPLDAALCPQVDEDVREYLLEHLDAAFKLLDRDTADRAAYHRSIAAAAAHLRENIYAATHLGGQGALALVGHSHVDVAYHWSVRNGVRKNARTTVVQLALMDEYPEFLYCHTQPFVYEMLRDHYPELFERVKEKVRAGQWELVGATYVEPDCNVPSGESLIRQCLLGKLFYLREFGVDVDTVWLPDVFGNSWVMPQILARAGIRYFVSNKMSTWNDTNEFPHTNFIWRGVDGTDVCACVPASHFISWLAPDQLLANWAGFKEKTAVGESMNMYGFGDGGGGATRDMLETARRIRHFPGLPRTRLVSGKGYLDEAFAHPERLDVWDDELYLEMHRGTPTTKGALKRLNRRCELAAREAELFAVLAEPCGAPVPRERLTAAWKQVLVNQFHDILPGSHTTPVGDEAEATYADALATFQTTRDRALDALCRRVATNAAKGRPVVVFNSLGGPRTDVAEIRIEGDGPFAVHAPDGQPVPCQLVEGEGGRSLLFLAADVPACGYRVFSVGEGPSQGDSLKASKQRLENVFFRIRLNRRGELTRLVDKRAGRHVLADGQRGNVLELFEDKPGNYDAWDIVPTYRDKSWPIPAATRIEVVERGPVRAAVRIEREFLESRLVQTIRIYAGLPRIDFHTWVHWRERNKLLKVAFPVAVLARHATYDLGYGSIQRTTHRNTSWDQARFEVCGHKWADLSEAGYGVSLLNDSKYGWDIEGSRIRLSLLRGSIRPDPDSDLGDHVFTYSLYPHVGAWHEAGTVEAAYALNCPLLARAVRPHAGELPAEHSFVSVDAPNVHVGALKPAEEGEGAILRLVEQHGARGQVAVRLARPVAAVEECDLLERPEHSIEPAPGGFRTTLRPFEIKSFRIRFA